MVTISRSENVQRIPQNLQVSTRISLAAAEWKKSMMTSLWSPSGKIPLGSIYIAGSSAAHMEAAMWQGAHPRRANPLPVKPWCFTMFFLVQWPCETLCFLLVTPSCFTLVRSLNHPGASEKKAFDTSRLFGSVHPSPTPLRFRRAAIRSLPSRSRA